MSVLTQRPSRSGLWYKVALAICLTIALNTAIFTLLWTTQMAEMGTLLPTGRTIPTFTLPDQDGRTHRLNDYSGRPLVLAFFSDLTPAVAEELRALRDSTPEFDRSGTKIFGISTLDSKDSKRFHDENHLPFPILHDTEAQTAKIYGAIDSRHRVRTASFAIDNTGTLMLALPGSQIDAPGHGKQLLRMASCCFDPVVTGTGKSVGQKIADCVLPRTDGAPGEHLLLQSSTSSHSADIHATLVLFVSSRCPCSQGYDARFKALAEVYQAKGVRFLAVNASADESVAEAEAHRQRIGFPFPMLKDPHLLLADRLGARVTPEAFVLDVGGTVRYSGRFDDSRDPTRVTRHDVQEALDSVLAGKRPALSHGNAPGCAIVR